MMGSGHFDTVSYSARAAARAASGRSLFTHSRLHATMDVRNKRHRESRDNDDSPSAFPLAVIFDVTGSMRDVPNYLQKELGKLMGYLLNEGVVPNPQLLFGAIGDAFSDTAPLQLGEFEADDALVESGLAKLFLEGGGGGSKEESYELALYFFERHVQTDAWEKRRKKGALFLIGDEGYYPSISPETAKRWLGEDLAQEVATADVVRALQQCWEVYLIRPGGTYHFDDRGIEQAWQSILPPQHVLRAPEREQIVPTIAMTIGALAGRELAASAAALTRHGFESRLVDAAVGALLPRSEGGRVAVRL